MNIANVGENISIMDEQIEQYIKNNLRINIVTKSVYNGGFDTNYGSMYIDHHIIQLVINDEVISSVSM